MPHTDKIGGFDRWDVEQGARDMIRVQEIETDPKFHAVVVKELEKQAKASAAALLVAKVSKNLKALGK
ncbi:hypothetical protein LCGC14_0415530 [marine sediment metagenome]|uniref:Uncharacterized protein n=1 Tax=marine sediment metagenome TaxID=412755 RepID=A0A0F9TAD0_9ZZZZ